MGTFWIVFLIFFLPLVINPFGPFAYEQPKVIVAELAIELFAFTFILAAKSFRNYKFSAIHLFSLLGIFLLTLIQLLDSPQKQLVFGNIFRLQGIYLLWHLMLLSLLSVYVSISKKMGLFTLISLILLSFSVFLLPSINDRSIGTLGEPNALGATAVILLPFLLLLKNRILKIMGLSFGLIPITFSGSRSALIALFIIVLFLVFNKLLKVPAKTATIFCIIIILFSWYLPIFDKNLSLSKNRVYENRIEIWKTSFYAGLEKPLIGHGFGNIQVPIKNASVKLTNNIRFQVVDSSHNFLLDFWVQSGIIGVGILLILIGTSLSFLIKKEKYLEISLFLGVITVMSFNPISVVTLIVLWWLIGQGFGSGLQQESKHI